MMKKKQDLLKLEREIISSVNREMQRPRLTESVRESLEKEVAFFAKAPSASSKALKKS
jgi:hypothetical protein